MFGRAAAAAACSKLLGLTVDQAEYALGIIYLTYLPDLLNACSCLHRLP